MERIFYINKYHRGHHTIIKGTLKELTEYFGYTLDCGYSWNKKINTEPKTYKSLISNLNKSYHETQGTCFDNILSCNNFETNSTHFEIFPEWHNKRYLKQCLFNLQEKYDCGGIPKEDWKWIQETFERYLK